MTEERRFTSEEQEIVSDALFASAKRVTPMTDLTTRIADVQKKAESGRSSTTITGLGFFFAAGFFAGFFVVVFLTALLRDPPDEKNFEPCVRLVRALLRSSSSSAPPPAP